MENKTKVILTSSSVECQHKKGDEGYIDGYVRGANDCPYAVVIVGENVDLVDIHLLKVTTHTT